MNQENKLDRTLLEPLTRREQVILQHLAEHKSNREIAEFETLSVNSVKWYVQQVFGKLGVNKRSDAIRQARRLGLLNAIAANEAGTIPISPAKHNLPAPLTSFIGREAEMMEIRELFTQPYTRLLTLTGSGGTGKTRLALRLASESLDLYPDGVVWVDLTSLTDPVLVPQIVMTALGLQEQPVKDPLTYLSRYLRDKNQLVILDNCEHLVEACAELAFTLLQSAKGLKIVATSREILGVAGEVAYRVPSLRMPSRQTPASLEDISSCDAVQLFLVRARGVSSSFRLTERNHQSIATIAHRLDGIPLALELAAARVRILSVEQITERLDDVFQLLTNGSRTALPRQKTLAAAIDWSYNLLSESERRLLRCLSVFSGGCSLEAAEVVCGMGSSTLDLLGRLVDKSLVQAELEPAGVIRYHMLETIRLYAQDRLQEAGETQADKSHHLAYYHSFLESMVPKIRGRDQINALNEIGFELDNLRAALDWALKTDVLVELKMASALQWFWQIQCRWAEGISWLERGLERLTANPERVDPSETAIRASALSALGFHIMLRDTPIASHARPLLEEALALHQISVPNPSKEMAWTLFCLGECSVGVGDTDQAQKCAREALALFGELKDLHGQAACLQLFGQCESDVSLQRKYYEGKLAILQGVGDTDGIASAYNDLGGVGFFDGNYASAAAAYQTSRELNQRVGNLKTAARNGLMLAIVTHFSGQVELASEHLEAAYTENIRLGIDIQIAFCIFWKCVIAISRGDYLLAENLIAEADELAKKIGDPLLKADAFYYRAKLSRLRNEPSKARQYAQEAIKTRQFAGYSSLLELMELGLLDLTEGELQRARRYLKDGLTQLVQWKQALWAGAYLHGFGRLALSEGKHERATQLFASRLCQGHTHTLSLAERQESQVILGNLRKILGSRCFEKTWEKGQEVDFLQATALAQEV